jgi:surface polysaccharide O-acyltransferase-like enzyme
MLTFYFILGIVSKMQREEIIQLAQPMRSYLPSLVVVLGVLAFVDVAWVSRLEGLVPTLEHRSFFAYGYATVIALTLIATERTPTRGTKHLIQLNGAVYGIYLLHPLLLEYLARAVHRFAPWFLAYPIAFVASLVVGGIGLPLFFMSAVRRSPFKRSYRYLFG